MKINSVENNSNKTSFGWTIPLRNVEKRCGLDTFRFANNMNGLGQYDVYIKPLKTKTTRERDLGCWGPLIYMGIGAAGAVGTAFGVTELMNFAGNIPIDSILRPLIAIPAIIAGGFGSISAFMFKRYNDFSVQAATQRGESDDYYNPTPAGIITKEYTIKNDANRYNPRVDFIKEITELKQQKFNDFIRHYDTNDLFQAKNFARVLANKPTELPIAEFLNYKIDDKGNTLMTAFFDVVPDDKHYPKMIEYLKRHSNLDFTQKDGNGISCIEKVLISENKDALELILNAKYTHEFRKPYCWFFEHNITECYDEGLYNPKKIPYSPELDDIYPNIQDKEFKKMVDDNIIWDFSNWIAVIQSHDVSKAEKLKQRFNSPLLNKQQLYNDINKALSSCNDMNFITYMQTNFLKELLNNKKEK